MEANFIRKGVLAAVLRRLLDSNDKGRMKKLHKNRPYDTIHNPAQQRL